MLSNFNFFLFVSGVFLSVSLPRSLEAALFASTPSM